MIFDLLLTCYDIIFFIVLLRRFIFMEAIHIDKTDLINQRYQNMIVNILKNYNYRYSSYYIIKFIVFISIYAINLDIIPSYIF